MKIEMGESLFYSWLRHVKECQIVQTNWKVSPQWQLQHEDALTKLMQTSDAFFFDKYGYRIYKQNSNLSQLLQQAEVDVVGISMGEQGNRFYAIDVAFHESGLNYGSSREDTVSILLKKCLRTAMCLHGYLNITDGEIIFASPKIHNSIMNDLSPCLVDINALLKEQGFLFHIRLLANEEFESSVLQPILIASEGVSDTSELFLRSYQMCRMFLSTSLINKSTKRVISTTVPADRHSKTSITPDLEPIDYAGANLAELKVGKIAQTVMRSILESGSISDSELSSMQTQEYSKQQFDLQYPLLVAEGATFDRVRYYSKALTIKGKIYYMCSQWFEVSTNNDKPYLLKWISKHS